MKKLGQNFLKNKKKIGKIIDLLNLEYSDKVLEIGPGKGALTIELGDRNKDLEITAVEMDQNLIGYLEDNIVPKIRKSGNEIGIVHGNILNKLPEISRQKNDFNEYKVVGNIPYYITGKLFRVFEEIARKPKKIVLTVQKEVADRLVSKSPNASVLSTSVQFWADVKKAASISRKEFDPEPDVDSAVVILTPKNYKKEIKGPYYKTVKILFKHPRKTVLNNLSLGLEKEKDEIKKILSKSNIEPGLRPQNLSINQIKELSTLMYN